MPGSPTGNERLISRTGGFTILEVLLAITILAAGAILVFPGLHKSSDYLRYLSDRQAAESVLNNLFADAERRFKNDHHLRGLAPDGEIAVGNVKYRYHIEARPANAGGSLMELEASVNWLGEGTSGLTRSAYVAD